MQSTELLKKLDSLLEARMILAEELKCEFRELEASLVPACKFTFEK
jgi:hypothetical protein